MANFDETIGGVNFMVVDGIALVVREDSEERLDVDDVLKLSEFAAAAYEGLTGEPYVHLEYDQGEIVQRDGVKLIPKRGAHLPFFSDELERDCE